MNTTYTAEDYNTTRIAGSYANAAIIANSLAQEKTLSDSVKVEWMQCAERMHEKAHFAEIKRQCELAVPYGC